MSESLTVVENKWATPVAQELLHKHLIEDISAGIYATYVESMDENFRNSNSPRPLHGSTLARGEAPIIVTIDRDYFTHEENLNGYFLQKFNPYTGEVIKSEDEINLVWVGGIWQDGTLLIDDGLVSPRSKFSPEQIEIIYRHAQELEAAGLLI